MRRKSCAGFLVKMVMPKGNPSLINIDISAANKAAIIQFNKENNILIKMGLCKYHSNVVESDHLIVKRKMRQSMDFVRNRSAAKTIAGVELWKMLKKGNKSGRAISPPLTCVSPFHGISCQIKYVTQNSEHYHKTVFYKISSNIQKRL